MPRDFAANKTAADQFGIVVECPRERAHAIDDIRGMEIDRQLGGLTRKDRGWSVDADLDDVLDVSPEEEGRFQPLPQGGVRLRSLIRCGWRRCRNHQSRTVKPVVHRATVGVVDHGGADACVGIRGGSELAFSPWSSHPGRSPVR